MTWYFLEQTTQKARIEHTCYLCGQAIEKGSEYIKRKNKDDFELRVETTKMHKKCEKIAHEVYDIEDWKHHNSLEFFEYYIKHTVIDGDNN